jgi:hypothetical protein
MNKRLFGFAARAALATMLFASGCSGGNLQDGGDGGIDRDSGPDCFPSDSGYCGVCHVMTTCGEYPPGPYGMSGPSGNDGGQILPPCFTGPANFNPTGIWLFDGGNPQFASGVSLFQDLYCASQQMGQTYALIQMVITDDPFGRMQASQFALCINGPYEQWLASGGQVVQVIEQSDNGVAPSDTDLVTWAENYNTNYSLGADDTQVLLPLMDATHGFPVTYMVNLQTMQILKAHSYGADFGQIQADFTYLLDSGVVY